MCAVIGPMHAYAGEVTLKRDQYGMANVYAETVRDLYYGYGYAVAQDRLYSMDMARRSALGTVAEVLGAEYVDFDRQTRSNFWPASIDRQLDELDGEERDILEGYAAGMNAWIEQVEADPDNLMPQEYTVNGFEPTEWSARDVAMVFVGSMLHRFGDFNTEMENASLLQALTDQHGAETAQKMFDTLVTRGVEGAPTTIPAGDWDPSVREGDDLDLRPVEEARITDDVLREAAAPPPNFVNPDGTTLPRDQWRAETQRLLAEGGPRALRLEAASNLAILGPEKLDGAQAVLLNGPQFSWFRPAYTYSIGLHGAGFDVVGNTALAYPGIMFGHNGQVAWGSTWGAGDQVDIFRQTVNPENPEQYRRHGEWVDMDSREVTIDVRDGDAVTFTAYNTVHGPIVARDEEQNLAYAKKRAWSGAELDTLFSWVDLMRAQDFDDFLAALERSAVNVNSYYADAEGNIGYLFGGYYPKRAEGHDNRLPVSGEGAMDWEGIMPFETNPHVLNPSSNTVLNWNNRPAEGFPAPEQWWYSWMPADRVSVIEDAVDAQETFAPDEVWDMMIRDVAFTDVNAGRFIPFITEATSDLPQDDPRRQLSDRLAGWDHKRRDETGDGRYDAPEAAIMQTWLETLMAETFAGTLPEPYNFFFGSAGYPDPEAPGGSGQNISVGAKVLHYNMLGRGYDFFDGQADEAILSALGETHSVLTETYGETIDDWLAPVGVIRFSHKNFRGIPQTLPERETDTAIAMNRGTEDNMTVFSADGVRSYEVVPPGQSGFINPQGEVGPTNDDQLELYEDLGRKSVPLTADEIERTTVSTETLQTD